MVISNKAADEADPAEWAQHLLSEVSRGGSAAVKHCEGKVIREGGEGQRGRDDFIMAAYSRWITVNKRELIVADSFATSALENEEVVSAFDSNSVRGKVCVCVCVCVQCCIKVFF